MEIYLLLPLPAVLAAIWQRQLSQLGLFFVWATTSSIMLILMPIGSRDYLIYLRDFADMSTLTFGEAASRDPLYATFAWTFSRLGGSGEAFIALLAVSALFVKLTAIRKLTQRSALAVVLYMNSFFFLHEFTQVRAGLAIGIWMHAIAALSQSRARYLALTTVATAVHFQAALGYLILGLLNFARHAATSRAMVLVAMAIVAAGATTALDRFGYEIISRIPDPRTEIYLELAASDIWVRPNPFSAISMLAIVTALFGLHSQRWRHSRPILAYSDSVDSDRAIFISLLAGSCALSLLSSVSVAAFRISEHFFSLLPAGLWIAARAGGSRPRHAWLLWLIAAALCYLFVFHSPYLLHPTLGEPLREDS